MPTRSSSLGNNVSTAVDREIGSQYDNVRVVAENIESVVTVADHIDNVDTVATNIADVHAFSGSIVDVRTVAANIDNVVAVGQDIANVNTVAANVGNIDTIVTEVIPNIDEIANSSANAAIATTKADEAATSAANALVSEQNAKTSELSAAASEGTATIKAAEASASAIAAYNSELAAAAILDAFDDRYLGSFVVDPVTDNDGQPLLDGALYFNISANVLKVYDVGTTTWYTIPQTLLSSLLDVQLTSTTVGDMLSWNGAKWVNTSSVQEHITDMNNPHSVTKAQVGLEKVNNTADVDKNVLSATKWTTARTVSSTGDVTWEAALDGSVDATGVATLANSGVTAGTYNNSATAVKPLVIDAKGRVTGVGLDVTITPAWSSVTSTPTTISEYGITDAYTKTETDSALSLKAPLASPALTGTPTAPTATVGNSSTLLATTAFVNAEIANDTYSKTQIDTKLAVQKDASEIRVAPSGNLASTNAQTALEELQGDIDIRYTKTETDALLAGKVDGSEIASVNRGFKNYIINGNFDVWQRGTNFSGLTNGTYSADRWCVYDGVGNINYNVIRNAGIFTGGYGASYTWNSGTGLRSIIQFIENVTRFKVGSSVTVSFEAYTSSTPYSINVGTQAVRGAWASATAVVSSPIALTNTKTKYSVTLSVPDWSSIGIDLAHLEDTKLALKFDFAADTNGKDFIISNVQLEEGSVATPFENRPYGLELSLCRRYCKNISVGAQSPLTVNCISFEPMRTAPSVQLIGYSEGTGATYSAAAVDNFIYQTAAHNLNALAFLRLSAEL